MTANSNHRSTENQTTVYKSDLSSPSIPDTEPPPKPWPSDNHVNTAMVSPWPVQPNHSTHSVPSTPWHNRIPQLSNADLSSEQTSTYLDPAWSIEQLACTQIQCSFKNHLKNYVQTHHQSTVKWPSASVDNPFPHNCLPQEVLSCTTYLHYVLDSTKSYECQNMYHPLSFYNYPLVHATIHHSVLQRSSKSTLVRFLPAIRSILVLLSNHISLPPMTAVTQSNRSY